MVGGIRLGTEGLGLLAHARDVTGQSEGAASFYEQSTSYGKTWLRNGLLLSHGVLAIALALAGAAKPLAFMLLALVALTSSVIGRALFYVLVIPTTMPGAFFWKNRGFVEHVREVAHRYAAAGCGIRAAPPVQFGGVV